MADKYVIVPLGDERTKDIADVISNKTSKKILDFLSEHEASSGDISSKLGLPISTVEYNINKLVNAGLVEVKQTMWSVKGRKVEIYKLSRKMILIGSREMLSSKFKKFLSVVVASSAVALLLKYFYSFKSRALPLAESAPQASISGAKASTFISAQVPVWWWFLAGSIFTLIIYFLIDLKKK